MANTKILEDNISRINKKLVLFKNAKPSSVNDDEARDKWFGHANDLQDELNEAVEDVFIKVRKLQASKFQRAETLSEKHANTITAAANVVVSETRHDTEDFDAATTRVETVVERAVRAMRSWQRGLTNVLDFDD